MAKKQEDPVKLSAKVIKEAVKKLENVKSEGDFIDIFHWAGRTVLGCGSKRKLAENLLGLMPEDKKDIGNKALTNLRQIYSNSWSIAE